MYAVVILRCDMRKIIKYLLSIAISAAAVYMLFNFVKGSLASGIEDYESSINSEVEAKRAELLKTGVYREGVTVNNVPIGGLTYDQAKELLAPLQEDIIGDIGFTVKYGEDKEISIGREYFSFEYNTEDILTEAMGLATEGSLESLRQQIESLAKNGKNYDIECRIIPDTDSMAKVVEEAAESLNVEPRNASVKVDPESVYTGGDRFVYKKEKNGYKAKTEDAVNEIVSRAKKADYGTVIIEGEIVEPKIKVKDLQDRVVMRATYKSSYALGHYDAPNRVANIDKACRIINGTVLEPGDVFSCNKKLGKRTLEGGWLPAPGFINSGANSVDSPGGGVCHVSSTIYNTVIKSDLKIVYRINHSSHVGYVPWGQDATIDSNGPDFQFANNTSEDIYLFTWVDFKKQRVCCEIWGKPFGSKFDSIDFYAELIEEVPPTDTEYIFDRNLTEPFWYVSNSAKTGYKYQSYKQYMKNGEPVGEPVPVALSVYRMHPKRIAVWPGFDPAVDYLSYKNRIEAPVPES